MVSTVYFFLCQLLQFSFKNCFVHVLYGTVQYTHKNRDFGAISVTGQSCAASTVKLDCYVTLYVG